MNKPENLYHCILVDDEPNATQNLELLLAEISEVAVVQTINDSRNALAAIDRHQPDMVFLDIEMPHLDGFEILEQIVAANIETHVVFATAFDNFVLQALRYGAFDYLNKPIDTDELKQVIERFVKHKNQQQLKQKHAGLKTSQLMKLPIQNQTKYVATIDIVLLRADGNYTEIRFANNRQELSSYNLGWFEKNINSKQFLRISRSILINSRYLKEFDRQQRKCIIALNQTTIELNVSRRNCSTIKSYFEQPNL